MANAFTDALRGVGGAIGPGLARFGQGFAMGMAPADVRQQLFAEEERKRQEAAMNPLRLMVQEQLMGPANTFAGGPASEFSAAQSMPLQGAQPAAQPMQAPVQAPITPLPPGLPPDMSPPPDIDAAIQQAAARHGVPVNALRAIASQESGGHGFRPDVVGETAIDLPGQVGDRAVGTFQFTPQTAQGFGIDPTDPAQSADAAARMLKDELGKGSTIDEAMAAHFGGPDRSLWGPRTREYHDEITQRFQVYEQATGAMQAGPPQQPVQQVAAGQQGPFGTVVEEPQEQENFGRKLLEMASADPEMFNELFAGEGGIGQIAALLRGGDDESQTKVVSGDTPEGQAMGLGPGERARVKGRTSPNGQFFPMEVVAKPFAGAGAGGEGSGILVNLGDLRTGEVVTRRRDDPEVDQMIQQGAVSVPDGEAWAQFEKSSNDDRKKVMDSLVATEQFINTTADALQLLQEQPDANTWTARGAALLNDFKQEAKAMAGALGVEFDDNLLNVSTHDSVFTELGIDNARMKSLITTMAFQRAAAESGVGRVTNRMMTRFIEEVGGSSTHTPTLEAVLHDIAARTERAFRINYRHRMGAEYEGDVGLSRLPARTGGERSSFPPAGEAAPAGGQAAPVTITSDAEYEALPSGTTFTAPDGSVRRKP